MSDASVLVGDKRRLDWPEIQARIDWCVKQGFNFERCLQNQRYMGHHGWYIYRFYFDNPAHAVLFKLAWGGE